MKKIMLMMVMMVTIVTSAKAISFTQAREEALFLTDKMAYELRLSPAQYEAVYEINLDYMLAVAVNDDLYGTAWARRNSDLWFVLSIYQYEAYQDTNYFYRPLYWSRNRFEFRIYSMYTDRSRFYVTMRPHNYDTFRGGHNVGNVSHYANRNFDKPVNIRPAMTGKPKPTWRDVPSNSRNEYKRPTTPNNPPRPNNPGQTTTRKTYNNDNSISRTRTVTTTRTTTTRTPSNNNSSSHGTTTAPGAGQSKSKGTFGGKR